MPTMVSAAVMRQPALHEHADAVAQLLHVAEHVGTLDDRLALVPQAQDGLADHAAADGVEAAHGFVQNEQRRIAHQRHGKADTLAHALGKAPDPPVSNVLKLQQPGHPVPLGLPLRGGQPAQPPIKGQGLARRQVFIEVGLFGHVTDQSARLAADNILAEQTGRSAGGVNQPAQQLDGGGFPRPVAPHKAENLVLGDLQVEPLQRPHRSLAKNLVGLAQRSRDNCSHIPFPTGQQPGPKRPGAEEPMLPGGTLPPPRPL